MEVSCHTKDNGLTLWYTLFLIGPLAGELDSSLDCFGTSVHWQNHVEAKHGSNFLSILAKDGVVECSRRQGQLLSLLDEGRENSRVAVALRMSIVRQI